MKPRKRVWWKVWLRRIFLTHLAIVMLVAAFVAWTNFSAYQAGKGKLYDRVEDVPAGTIGLVFGCPANEENPYFRHRMDAAAELWKAGKITSLIVSGDNRDHFYNEPEKMKRSLVKRGVPAEKIICDYAGLRTLDSVVRAKEVFHVKAVVLISQRFQNERAAYIAEANGLKYTGFNAQGVTGKPGLRVQAREILARVRMWLDVRVLGTRPAYSSNAGDLAT